MRVSEEFKELDGIDCKAKLTIVTLLEQPSCSKRNNCSSLKIVCADSFEPDFIGNLQKLNLFIHQPRYTGLPCGRARFCKY